MKKLLELLNEYEENRIEKINSKGELMVKLSFKPYTEESLTNKAYRSCWEEICSKDYGFIKWLVDNDKIDQTVIDGNFGYFCMEGFDTVDSLLMVLAISNEPINDLISYLK